MRNEVIPKGGDEIISLMPLPAKAVEVLIEAMGTEFEWTDKNTERVNVAKFVMSSMASLGPPTIRYKGE